MEQAPKGFCTSLPYQPRIWDPSLLTVAATCWRKHWYQTVRGFRRNGPGIVIREGQYVANDNPSVHLTWGKEYHRCVELYDRLILAGVTPRLARSQTVCNAYLSEGPWGEYIKTWRCTDPEMVPAKRMKVWKHRETGEIRESVEDATHPSRWELVPKMIPNRGRCKFAKAPQPIPENALIQLQRCPACQAAMELGEEFLPYHPKKTGETLVAAVKAYCDSVTSLHPYAFPDGTKALELQARLPLQIDSPDEELRPGVEGELGWLHYVPYELLVNIDSLVEWEGEIAIRERKTTGLQIQSPKVAGKYWAQFNPNIQIEAYDLVGSVLYPDKDGRPPKILVETLSIANPEAPYLERRTIHLSEFRRDESLNEIEVLIHEAEIRAASVATEIHNGISGEASFPRNPTACTKGYGLCPFYQVCTAASAEEREAVLATHYHVERWVPEAAATEEEE